MTRKAAMQKLNVSVHCSEGLYAQFSKSFERQKRNTANIPKKVRVYEKRLALENLLGFDSTPFMIRSIDGFDCEFIRNLSNLY